ncbi:DUF4190 domain-containing protein [Microbacterium lacticum]|uniref:DUF4190 domain-containing protein n=1 Tax=Microbacterium lacticum TaxID=33885 RepID=A0A4Y3UJW0_9MICO|nr:DUF4190 domain-containing protein [Microbacterium lacticum]TQM95153.1 hypothetical protein FHX68_2496 [Microbacterium lacticum]GEB94593.1 hypothetical protein MLA01_08120 [Microbacterium lacticum]
MTDPNTPDATPPANQGGAQPTPPAQPAQPAYGEYAPTTQPPAAPAYGQNAAPAYSAPAYNAAPAYNGAAGGGTVPGKTLGIVAFIVSFFFGPLGLILGIVALVQSKKAGRGNGFAITAIIIGAISVVVGLIVIFAVIVPSLNAATTCLNDPTAVVQVWGVDLSCQEVLEQSNR